MTAKKTDFPADKTERERRKNLDERQIDELALAGGVEGGMQAGSAGGPGEKDHARASHNHQTRKSSGRTDHRH
jgi:hypothetical protein